MATIMYPNLVKSESMRSKRKSAVELLAESKPFYVKSVTVRNSQQALPLRSAPFNTIRTTIKPIATPQYMAVSPSRSLPPLRVNNNRKSASDVLQNKLRKLLDCDSCDNIPTETISPPAEYAVTERSSYCYAQSSPVHKSLPDLHSQACCSKSASNKSLSNRDSGDSSGHYTHRSEPPAVKLEPRDEVRRDSGSSTQHSLYYQQDDDEQVMHAIRQTYQPTQLSPGLGVFTRQKCLRYKQRDCGILRSKSDVSDRYQRPRPKPPDPPISHLELFFDHLGLNSDSYESMLGFNGSSSESPVFFSDVSTVDSNRPLDGPEYCPTLCRSSEPPSIVERNARIIKWLCNCRKVQLSHN